MKLGKRTAKLLREAIVLAHVEGARFGQVYDQDATTYPKDSDVVRRVLAVAVANKDLYPTLAKLDEAKAADAELRELHTDLIRAVIGSHPTNTEENRHA